MKYYMTANKDDANRVVNIFNEKLGYPKGDTLTYTTVDSAVNPAENHVLVAFEGKYLSLLSVEDMSKCIDTPPKTFSPNVL